MPRFFFHVREQDDVSLDTEGQELPDLAAARREALNADREMLGEQLLHGGTLGRHRIEIANEKGEVLAALDSRDTLFEKGQFRSFQDDVTKSAPTVKAIASKPPSR